LPFSSGATQDRLQTRTQIAAVFFKGRHPKEEKARGAIFGETAVQSNTREAFGGQLLKNHKDPKRVGLSVIVVAHGPAENRQRKKKGEQRCLKRIMGEDGQWGELLPARSFGPQKRA